MSIILEKSWKEVLEQEFSKPYMNDLRRFLKDEQQQHQVFPANKLIFNAFEHTPFQEVKVVILGQDPYHNVGQAHGLSFSVQQGVAIPPSLRNMYTELSTDIEGFNIPKHGTLTKWADQGVLLLNAVLTVRAHIAASHQKRGWEIFTDTVIKELSNKRENIVFILWGNYAKQKIKLIDTTKHFVITSAHPSPLSAHNGFFGSKPFSKTNKYLIDHNKSPIDWSL